DGPFEKATAAAAAAGAGAAWIAESAKDYPSGSTLQSDFGDQTYVDRSHTVRKRRRGAAAVRQLPRSLPRAPRRACAGPSPAALRVSTFPPARGGCERWRSGGWSSTGGSSRISGWATPTATTGAGA